MDSNASYAGEVERNVSRDNDFSLRGKLHQKYQLVLGQSYRTRRSSKMSCSRRPSTPRVEGLCPAEAEEGSAFHAARCSWRITIRTGGLFILAASGPELARRSCSGFGGGCNLLPLPRCRCRWRHLGQTALVHRSSSPRALGSARACGRGQIPASTEENLLRQVVYEGLREDKDPATVRRPCSTHRPRAASHGRRLKALARGFSRPASSERKERADHSSGGDFGGRGCRFRRAAPGIGFYNAARSRRPASAEYRRRRASTKAHSAAMSLTTSSGVNIGAMLPPP